MKSSLLISAAILSIGVLAARGQVILSTDFSNATAGNYANGAVIGTGNSTQQVAALVSANTTVAVVDQSGTNSVRITDNDPASASAGITKTFQSDTFVASQGTLQGSITFTPLALSSGNRSYFALTLNSGTVAGPGGNTAVQLFLRDNLTIQYNSGGTNTTPGITLATGTTYRWDFTFDFTNPSNETWSFSIYNVTSSSTVYTSSLLNARNNISANGTAGNDYWTMGLQGAAFLTGASPDPYVSIGSLSLQAVPEPQLMAFLGAGLLVAFWRSRKQTRAGQR